MNIVTEVVALTTLAGLAIPLGGLLARVERIQPRWLEFIFQDIAPQAKLCRHCAPALGVVAGFLVGLISQMLIAPALVP